MSETSWELIMEITNIEGGNYGNKKIDVRNYLGNNYGNKDLSLDIRSIDVRIIHRTFYHIN